MAWKLAATTGLERFRVAENEWVTVVAGFVMVLTASPVLIVDGVLRLDGVVRVG